VQRKSTRADNKQNVKKRKWGKNKRIICSATQKYQTVGEGNKLLGTHHLLSCKEAAEAILSNRGIKSLEKLKTFDIINLLLTERRCS